MVDEILYIALDLGERLGARGVLEEGADVAVAGDLLAVGEGDAWVLRVALVEGVEDVGHDCGTIGGA